MAIVSWTWDSDLEGWELGAATLGSASVSYEGSDGDPNVGCMEISGVSSNFLGSEYADAEISFGGVGFGYVIGAGGSQVQLNVKSVAVLYPYVRLYANLRMAGWVYLGCIWRIGMPFPCEPSGSWETYYESIGIEYAGDILDGFRIRMEHEGMSATGTHTIRVDTAAVDNLTPEGGGPTGSKYAVGGAGGFSNAAMDVDKNDDYLYVAVLDSGNPKLVQQDTALSMVASEKYDPGAGSAINVVCGDEYSEWIWICGDFGGTDKVAVSIDGGDNWIIKDPGTWNGVAQPMLIGPDNDNIVLVATNGDDDMFETEDGGLSWHTLQDNLPFDLGAVDRLDINPDEAIIGADTAGADRVRYTPNEFDTLHDITVGTPNSPVTSVIVG